MHRQVKIDVLTFPMLYLYYYILLSTNNQQQYINYNILLYHKY
jgi:hypothetical protein